MFGRFTEKAQQALVFAQQEASSLNHNYVGTEHLLLGLIRQGDGVAAVSLKNLGVDLEKVRNEIVKIIGTGDEGNSKIVGYTPRTKRVLELSLAEARSLGHNYIGTEHLLLGLIREGEGVAAKVLHDLDISFDKTRQEVMNHLNSNPSSQENSKRKQKTNTPTLEQFGRDLTELAREGKIDPVIGREKEIERVIQILSRRTKNNPCLIGEPGVGKTAIAEGLAQRIIEGSIPENLKDKKVVTLDLSGMVAGAKYRGEFEDRLKKVMEEIRNSADVILFIDELHTIVGAGAAEGAIDASNIIKPALARGELQTIGATTLDEYKKYIEKDSALERRFQPIQVGEPTTEETLQILKGLRDRYEAHHRVKITDEALKAAVELSDRYITDRFLPDKAIDLVDEAASRVRLSVLTAPPEIKELEEKIEKFEQEKAEAISSQDYEKAARIRDEQQKSKNQLEEIKNNWKKKNNKSADQVDEEDIAHIVSSWTGVPVKKLAEEESDRLLNLEEELHRRVIGQDEAVNAVSKAIRRARVGLKDPNRPIGSFIFLGPTGVGKTELSKALAEVMFGDENAMIRIDMSEYMEKHTVSRLIGSPPGYVGYEEGGQLTEKVRRKPYSVVLMDEIEKAHPDVFNILLQILEDGRLTDGKGRTVDFKNTVVIMTSNVGAHTIRRQKSLGFATAQNEKDRGYEKMKGNVMEELRKTFRPEFLNRLDEIIVFHQLEDHHLKEIISILLERLAQRLKDLNIYVEFTDNTKEFLAKEGFDLTYGARPLRRAIQKKVEDQLSEEMLKGSISTGDHIVVDAKDGKLEFRVKE
ncbi:ATP-dependent Clp protease ATP-binding subunit [Irregularibacter muris]|uniref:ATP-dependent Clp protease ATP-binding subunit n=1 Tax=Irregularibacter muris TaxID=1796619 RepID=A0AAE3HGP7_9FIRM|nr:ATP-dependent Clp protease ATP-binding subunit [Irregularibacter muris]MCR1898714.1 ATP-dependent Clp protease ATP-binding subunit [Irregularibacter muris]